jgi:hypothetical protein
MRTLKWIVALIAAACLGPVAQAQSGEVGKQRKLIFHDIRTDRDGKLLPWYSDDPGTAYDHVLGLLWSYWKYMPAFYELAPGGKPYGGLNVKKYLVFRTLEDQGVGGDQFAMLLSSWKLYYAYSGDREVLDNMIYQADYYLAHGLSAASSAWPNLPYPCNLTRDAVYDGDLTSGKDITQPDKAASFAAELVDLYKITGERKYLDAADGIARTLAARTRPGDADNSPLPFKVNAVTGEVKSRYTTNWTGALRLFESLIALKTGDAAAYQKAFDLLSAWLKQYPMKTNKWGPFFEDIPGWSDTEINEGSIAWYILEHPSWDANWKRDVRAMQDWAIGKFTIRHWEQYGLTVIGEQTVYNMQGNSHTSRHASVELRYAEESGDRARVEESIRQLSWATYMVDFDGKNRYPNFNTYELWWTDGYGDYVRHYLRAMAACPRLAPPDQDHLLRSTSIVKSVEYSQATIRYSTFDNSATEVLRLKAKPRQVTAGGAMLRQRTAAGGEGWTWEPLKRGGILRLRHNTSADVMIRM